MTNSKNAKKATSSASSVSSLSGDSSMLEEFFIGELKDIYWAEKASSKSFAKNGKGRNHATIKGRNK